MPQEKNIKIYKMQGGEILTITTDKKNKNI